jgi:hypothetical protein
MPLFITRTPYYGVNAHHHSAIQTLGMGNFHARHIVHLAEALSRQLRSMGYRVAVEESLQIRRDFGDIAYPPADVLIYDSNPVLRSTDNTALAEAPTTQIAELLDEYPLSDKPYRAVAIYKNSDKGKPVAWLELLSPSNKGKSDDAQRYVQKREDLIALGVVFVELDYLHEQPPTFRNLPIYRPPFRADAHPYWIVVLDPREQGRYVKTAYRQKTPFCPYPKISV